MICTDTGLDFISGFGENRGEQTRIKENFVTNTPMV